MAEPIEIRCGNCAHFCPNLNNEDKDTPAKCDSRYVGDIESTQASWTPLQALERNNHRALPLMQKSRWTCFEYRREDLNLPDSTIPIEGITRPLSDDERDKVADAIRLARQHWVRIYGEELP